MLVPPPDSYLVIGYNPCAWRDDGSINLKVISPPICARVVEPQKLSGLRPE
jgi:hypothetical protein